MLRVNVRCFRSDNSIVRGGDRRFRDVDSDLRGDNRMARGSSSCFRGYNRRLLDDERCLRGDGRRFGRNFRKVLIVFRGSPHDHQMTMRPRYFRHLPFESFSETGLFRGFHRVPSHNQRPTLLSHRIPISSKSPRSGAMRHAGEGMPFRPGHELCPHERLQPEEINEGKERSAA